VAPQRLAAWAQAFAEQSEAEQAVALLAWHVQRMPAPIELLARLTRSEVAWRRALAYQALGDGEGHVDAMPLAPGAHDPCPEVRLAALWAMARKAPVAPPLADFVAVAFERDVLAERALDLAARCGAGAAAADRLLRALPAGESGQRAGVRAIVAAGLPSHLPWLWPRLRDARTAQLAGWAYAAVAGCDLREAGLVDPQPTARGVGPNEDPGDPTTQMPSEYRAPWPDASAIEAHWQGWGPGAGQARTLLGRTMTSAVLRQALVDGTQSVRAHAALELSLLDRRSAVFCTRAPAFRQRARLAACSPNA
jgi:hypothetical protein